MEAVKIHGIISCSKDMVKLSFLLVNLNRYVMEKAAIGVRNIWQKTTAVSHSLAASVPLVFDALMSCPCQ